MKLKTLISTPGEFLKQLRIKSGLGLREAARLAETSHATFSAYENNKKNPTIDTYFRLLTTCNFSIEVHLLPRIRYKNGLKRGDELIEALNLAEQFPAKHTKNLSFPKFGR